MGYTDTAVDLWDLGRPTDPARPLDDHREAVTDLAFSPDNRILASTGADQTVRLWDLADPGRPPTVLRGHTDTVNSLAWSPDSHRLASGSDDRTVQLWNVDDAAHATRMGPPLPLGPTSFGANAFVTAVAYAPDGHSLAIASTDTTVRVWDLDADTLTRRICATAAHNVTAATWQQYFRDQPFPGAPCG